MPDLSPGYLTDVRGLTVGHATNLKGLTGCTVVLCGKGAVAGGCVRGLAPGTREIALLRPGTLVKEVHAVLLTGGSAYGLAAADGVMRYLEEQGVGYAAGDARVPIVPAAVLYDLGIGDAMARPDASMGYGACRAAQTGTFAQGNVGAGTGATVGKLLGGSRATKAGIGTASLHAGRLVVAALVAVNAVGDIVDPTSGDIVAGARNRQGGWVNSAHAMRGMLIREAMAFRNTVIGVVASNARLDATATNLVAEAAHDGLARVVRPSHTLYDGDTLFALSTGQVRAALPLVSDMAAEAVALAILNGIRAARDAGGLPSASSLVNTRDA